MSYKKWSKQDTKALYDMKKRGMSFPEIDKKLGRSKNHSVKKYHNMNWELFFADKGTGYREWSDKDLLEVYSLRTNSGLSYPEIGKRLGRSTGSVTNKFKHTDWKKKLKEISENDECVITQEMIDDESIDKLTNSLMEVSRHSPKRLANLTKKQFEGQVKLATKTLPITYTELKRKAMYELEQIGYCYPSYQKFAKGTYIVVGDTHGKHTRTGMFKMIQTLNDYIEADKIIHIGHMLDDDNDVNYNWDDFDNFMVLAREEELKQLAKETNKKDKKRFNNIVRKEVMLGNLAIQNQDLITDYVQTALGTAITPDYFESSTVVNLHRHELDSRCTEEGDTAMIASPGCICENHIVYTIKQQDFTDGRTVKQTFPTGYKKYRRMKHMYKKWQQGLLVVHVNGKGDFQIVQCRIKKTSKGFTTSYFDKIISEDYVIDPDQKGFVHADLHIDKHCLEVLDIQEQFCKDYKPDYVMNLGDTINHEALNHHEMKIRGCGYIDKDVLNETATTHFILSRVRTWADEMYVMKGNHERFAHDFVDKNPQFKTVLDFEFVTAMDSLDIEVTDMKKVKKVGGCNYVHGEMRLIGSKGGDVLDKLSRTFGKNTMMGHSHCLRTRADCYVIGLSGELDQDYNETAASRWIQGFGTCNTFENKAFITNYAIVHGKCIVNHKVYTARKLDKWDFSQYSVSLSYDFE